MPSETSQKSPPPARSEGDFHMNHRALQMQIRGTARNQQSSDNRKAQTLRP